MADNKNRYVIHIKRNSEKIRWVTFFAFLAVVCLPFHTINVGGVGLLMLTGLPLMVLSMPALLMRIREKKWDKATIILALFFVYNILGYFWTPSFSISSLYNYIKICVIVMCMYCQKYNQREKSFLLAGTIISCMIVCWFMLSGRNIGYEDRRMTIAVFGVLQDPNYIGYLFIAPMAVAVTGFMNQRKLLQKLLYGLLGSIILLCIMLTGSRGAFLGLSMVICICVLKRFQRLSSKILFCAVMFFGIAMLYRFILTLLPEYIAARFSLQVLANSGGTGRWDIWMYAIRVMTKTPYKLLFGFGTGSSVPVIGMATHNYILQLLLEHGIVGTGLFISFFCTWVKRLALQDTMCLSIFVGCMALAMTLSVNTNYYFWYTFILSIICSKAKSDSVGG